MMSIKSELTFLIHSAMKDFFTLNQIYIKMETAADNMNVGDDDVVHTKSEM